MNTKGNGSVLPIAGEQRITGGVGHVKIGSSVIQGTNLPNGQVQTPDGKIHGPS